MKNLIVIDNFYKDPIAVREMALETTYKDVRRLNYPGTQSEHAFYNESIIEKFQDAIGEEIDPDVEALTFGKFRFMTQEHGSRIKVHLDGFAEWTGLIYLNLPEQAEGGTCFYRHRATGLEGAPAVSEMKKYGFESAVDFESKIIQAESLDLNNWEETNFVGMRFNRLVIFRGNELFHCHSHGFGSAHEDSRLTQNFFFNSLKKERLQSSIYAKATP